MTQISFTSFALRRPNCAGISRRNGAFGGCLGDSGAVEALIRLGLGREDHVLVFRCEFATPPTPPVRMVSFQGAPNSLNRSELRVRAAIQPSLSPNFAQFRSRPRGPNVEKHFAKLLFGPTNKGSNRIFVITRTQQHRGTSPRDHGGCGGTRGDVCDRGDHWPHRYHRNEGGMLG